jgi:hypothetical protein
MSSPTTPTLDYLNMLLLDVPPEIFQRIIATCVYTVGIRKAAKIRETCSKCIWS